MTKQLDPIKLVAVERGFVLGRMIEPGQSFLFDPTPVEGSKLAKDGTRRIPKWAALPSDPKLSKPKPVAGDLKPKAAQEAVKAKSGALAAGI